MYKLISSDVDNSKYIKALEESNELYNELIKRWTADSLRYFIFYEPLDDKQFKILATALTCSDELLSPMGFKDANLLWFVLCANYANFNKEISLKITSPTHARYLIEECEGDFRKLNLENDHSDKPHKEAYVRFLARHTCLYPDRNLYWEIPVSFYKGTCMVSGEWATFAKVKLDGVEYKIPRSIFIKFFRSSISSGKIAGKSSNDIRLFFDETESEPVWETLKYMGFSLYKKIEMDDNIDYYYDKNEQGLIAHKLNKEAELIKDEEDEIYWKEMGPNTYRFLPRGAEYVPTKPISGIIFVYRN